MNTVDALTLHGGSCANFLDTGGKATAETVKSSFRVILSDPRVKGIFVNIFGGLTKCDMIAEGIMMAFRDLGMKVPVVVRLRGTNEELGQKMVCLSSLCIRSHNCLRPLLTPSIDSGERVASPRLRLFRASCKEGHQPVKVRYNIDVYTRIYVCMYSVAPSQRTIKKDKKRGASKKKIEGRGTRTHNLSLAYYSQQMKVGELRITLLPAPLTLSKRAPSFGP